MNPVFQQIIWDLDDTLLDTTGLLIPIANTPEFSQRIQQPLPLMAGAGENLEYLKGKYQLILLTQGRSHFQNQKIQSLGIRHFFDQVCIVDPNQNFTKADQFQKWKLEGLLKEGSFLSIGNRKRTDLRSAKLMGGWTCWFAYGEHIAETEEQIADRPDFTIYDHFQLRKMIPL